MKWVSLLVTAVCSQLVPWGFALFAFGALGGVFGSVKWIVLLGCFSPIMISGPILLGLYLNFGWRGLLASVLALIGGWLGILFTLYLPFYLPLFLGYPLFGIEASVIIIVLLMVVRNIKTSKDFILSLFGVSFGIGLTVMTLTFLRKESSGISIQFFLSFLWVWLSAIFFPDLFQRRVGRNDVVIWVVMMTAFPFIIDSIYTAVFWEG